MNEAKCLLPTGIHCAFRTMAGTCAATDVAKGDCPNRLRARESMKAYAIDVEDSSTLRVQGDGCEGFLIDLRGSRRELAQRIADLLTRANQAGHASAQAEIRRALGV